MRRGATPPLLWSDMQITKENRIEKKKLFKQGLKQCPRCPEPKPISVFGKDKNRQDGLKYLCKEHMKEYNDKPENKVKIAKRMKENYEKNREENLKKLKEYCDKPENKKKILKQMKERYGLNKEKILKQQKEYLRNRRKTNPNFKILCNLRRRICHALKGETKSLNTSFLIGCDIDYFMYYLQKKFTKGMTWDNYGMWHMDHIKPCAKFDLSKKSEQLECFHYTNLQPLWAEENRIKSDKF